ncbi:hypothetical protein F9C07_7531 [Aspergillus flavus]|uniref:Uncharacterized protein n=1 Tax=Aspergillus flavus (strain ATCC 200026 / FGSC A1120 / IAM 13836 / NRRL 3357 / JCM 12722 / SRRC 167) TaxID=332952 RepID=A0A7U2MN01_ASPFN|nr:hypothetical protein F9C07_7531 [Aspergillus flavus]
MSAHAWLWHFLESAMITEFPDMHLLLLSVEYENVVKARAVEGCARAVTDTGTLLQDGLGIDYKVNGRQ